MTKFIPDSIRSIETPLADQRRPGYYRRLRLRLSLSLTAAAMLPLAAMVVIHTIQHGFDGTLVGITAAAATVSVTVIAVLVNRIVRRRTLADQAREDLRQELFHAAKLASAGEMSAGVAHEINNPLAIIGEEAGLLRDLLDPEFGRTLDDDALRQHLDTIAAAAVRGRDITQKLLASSQQYDPTPKPTDLNELVRRTVESRERTFHLSHIQLVTDLAEGLPEVRVSSKQLQQVVLNLLNNARDAIGKKGLIAVATSVDGAWVRCDVRDTGSGIPADILPKIFFPFFTTKGVGRGTGLGLSLSYGIVKSLDGIIEVESEVGQGTTFSILLPVVAG